MVLHATLASFVLTLGPLQILRRRRDAAHRLVGRVWVGAMVGTCASSFAIHPHGFNWLHGLAVFTLASVTAGIVAISRGNILAHRRNMSGSYLGTLVAFGFAALSPNRAIMHVALTDAPSLLLAVTLILATSAAIVSIALRPRPARTGVVSASPSR